MNSSAQETVNLPDEMLLVVNFAGFSGASAAPGKGETAIRYDGARAVTQPRESCPRQLNVT